VEAFLGEVDRTAVASLGDPVQDAAEHVRALLGSGNL
jgi:hypothetical protein